MAWCISLPDNIRKIAKLSLLPAIFHLLYSAEDGVARSQLR